MAKRKKTITKIVSPDHKLDTMQFRRLNAQFYDGFHQEFVTGRLGILCVMHETPEVVEELLAKGVGWGKLKLRVEPDETSREALKNNAELELVALRQHAAEVLFRLFWVHAHQEPCPWIALARFRNPGDLKGAIEKYLSGALWRDNNERRKLHARSVWGISAVDENGSVRQRLDKSVDAVAEWIATAAKIVKDAPLYNAYKHGLAVVGSKPFALTLGSPDKPEDPLTMDGSAGFAYINRTIDESHLRHYWQLVTEPVDFEATAAEAATFGTLIGTILQAGALDRGVTERPQELKVLNPELTPDRVRSITNKSAFPVQSFGESLLYFK